MEIVFWLYVMTDQSGIFPELNGNVFQRFQTQNSFSSPGGARLIGASWGFLSEGIVSRHKNTAAVDMSLHWCRCGAKAVDKWRGDYVCWEHMMGPEEQPRLSLQPSNAGAIDTKVEFLDGLTLNKQITKWMRKHGVPMNDWRSEKYSF